MILCVMSGTSRVALCSSIARQTGASLTNCGRAPTTLVQVTRKGLSGWERRLMGEFGSDRYGVRENEPGRQIRPQHLVRPLRINASGISPAAFPRFAYDRVKPGSALGRESQIIPVGRAVNPVVAVGSQQQFQIGLKFFDRPRSGILAGTFVHPTARRRPVAPKRQSSGHFKNVAVTPERIRKVLLSLENRRSQLLKVFVAVGQASLTAR